LNELELAEASKPTLGERVRGSLITFRNAAIVVVIVVALCGGAFFAFRGTLNQPITPEQLARFRYAASGSFQTAEGINVNSTVLSAKVVSFTSQRVGFEATHLINEYVGDGYPGWRSTDATFPQEVVVQGQGLTAVSKVILTQRLRSGRIRPGSQSKLGHHWPLAGSANWRTGTFHLSGDANQADPPADPVELRKHPVHVARGI